jgi:DNA polymerase
MTKDEVRRYLEFYQDLGLKTLYRRDSPGQRAIAPDPPQVSDLNPMPRNLKPAAPSTLVPSLAPVHDNLLKILEDIGDCKRCRLHEGRNRLVFGTGAEQARLVFVGEGPGADEDAQGLPFVGRAGQLLTQMIEGTAIKRASRSSAATFISATSSNAARPAIAIPSPMKLRPASLF